MEYNIPDPKYESELDVLRRIAPVESAYWARRELLTVCEAVLLYYGIDPNGPHGIGESGFEFRIRIFDTDRINELIWDSFGNDSLNVNMGKIRVQELCDWLRQKKLTVPGFFPVINEIPSINKDEKIPVLEVVADVQKIDFNQLSPSVLLALGANIIAQARKRKDSKSDKKTKISEVLHIKTMESFIDDCSTAQDRGPWGDDTIRQYIEQQFQNS